MNFKLLVLIYVHHVSHVVLLISYDVQVDLL